MFKTLNAILNTAFSHHKQNPKYNFEYLADSPVLHSSDYLAQLYSLSSTKQEEDYILDHLYKFAAYEVDAYKDLENKIIKKRMR